jgi:hypothetical protein
VSEILPPLGFKFLVSEKVVFSKDTGRVKQGGKKGGQGRMERGREMGETVETLLFLSH